MVSAGPRRDDGGCTAENNYCGYCKGGTDNSFPYLDSFPHLDACGMDVCTAYYEFAQAMQATACDVGGGGPAAASVGGSGTSGMGALAMHAPCATR